MPLTALLHPSRYRRRHCRLTAWHLAVTTVCIFRSGASTFVRSAGVNGLTERGGAGDSLGNGYTCNGHVAQYMQLSTRGTVHTCRSGTTHADAWWVGRSGSTSACTVVHGYISRWYMQVAHVHSYTYIRTRTLVHVHVH